jgi:MoaA/NifB/PqqE/SkfB family radical SAM enzyme
MDLTQVIGDRLPPIYVIHFVTHRCNLFCEFCCDGHNRTQRGEMTLDEIRAFYGSLVAGQLTITGGEPSLRDDLGSILRAALEARVHSVSLNTNGMLPDRLERTLTDALSKSARPALKVNLSIDGFRETHDRMRGRAGAFDAVVESCERLLALALEEPFGQLRIRINTVVTTDNYSEVAQFRDFVRFRFPRIADHVFTLRRAGPGEAVAPELLRAYEEVTDRQTSSRGLIPKDFLLKRLHDRMYGQIGAVARGQPTSFRCPAGGQFVEVGAQGDVYGCEVLPKERARLGHLSDHGGRLSSVLRGAAAAEFRERIARERCACSFECAHLTAATIELPAALWRINSRPSIPRAS